MNKLVQVIAEGPTEQKFVENVLAPYLAMKGVYMTATVMSKPGVNGGDVRFSRACKQIANFLKQRSDTIVATFVDYYGVKEWPGLAELGALHKPTPKQISDIMNNASIEALRKDKSLASINVVSRYIPFLAVHEFEALLFSDPAKLAQGIGIEEATVVQAINDCGGSPELVNNCPETAPSKRIISWAKRYKKTIQGVDIAGKIGIDKIRSQCPLFDQWLNKLCASETLN